MDGFAVISLQAVWPSAVFPIAGVLMLGGRIAFQYHVRYSWVQNEVKGHTHLQIAPQQHQPVAESPDQRQAA